MNVTRCPELASFPYGFKHGGVVKITDEEYDAVLSWMYLNDLEGFTQEADSADIGFIPDF